MSEHLLLADAETAADALTFAGRAASLGDGAVRLTARHGILAITSAPLAPRGLFDQTPTVLGMRALHSDPELECDVIVAASELTAARDESHAIRLPETGLAPPWAGVSPPRSGWILVGSIPASTIARRAQWGITAVAESLPLNAGEDAVRAVRASVWGKADEDMLDLPLGVAFAAFGLGFIGGEELAEVRSAGSWIRITLARGHILVRGPARIGMGEVRETGSRSSD